MGIRNRQTREALKNVDEDEFTAFLDDVSDMGLTKACEARVWTVGATLNWIKDDDGRLEWYLNALKVKSEVLAHETLDIADGSREPKLQIDTRFKVAAKWHRERYGDQVTITHAPAKSEEEVLSRIRALVAANPGLRDIVAEQRPELLGVEDAQVVEPVVKPEEVRI